MSEQGGLYHGGPREIRVIWDIFHSDRINNGVYIVLNNRVYVEIWPRDGCIFKHPCVFVIPSSPLLPWGLLQSSEMVYITLT